MKVTYYNKQTKYYNIAKYKVLPLIKTVLTYTIVLALLWFTTVLYLCI